MIRWLTTVVVTYMVWVPMLFAQNETTFNTLETFFGRVKFVSSGASLTDAGGLNNGVLCLLPQATIQIPEFADNERPQLIAAYLYWGGSLIGDDDDFVGPDDIFDTTGLQADNVDDYQLILEAARQAADTEVKLNFPGAASLATITADSDGLYAYAYYKSAGNEQGNVAFYLARADITELLLNNNSPVVGSYTLSELQADVCNGPEAFCTSSLDTCDKTGMLHSNGNASFSIVLVLEDPTWRLRRVTLFEGLHALNSESVSLTLTDGIVVSDPPEGNVSYYILEGDYSLYSTEEYVSVDGGSQTIYLIDDDNLVDNPYNGTINAISHDPPLDACTELGLGDGTCGLAGVDIDCFDISSALAENSREITIEFSTAADRVVLAGVNVGVAVFSPILNLDSEILLSGDAQSDELPALSPVTFIAALSNTGNLPSSDTRVQIHMPASVASFTVESIPTGAVDQTSATQGLYDNGVIDIRNIAIDTGKISQIRFTVTPTCYARVEPLRFQADVTYEADPFSIQSPQVVIVGDNNDTCPPLEGEIGDLFWQELGLFLEGGGGCSAVSGSWFFIIGLLFFWRLRYRR